MNEFILYVKDQGRAREYYRQVLGTSPVLDVLGMTEFNLGGAKLGLMPATDMEQLIPEITAGSGQRCELYLRRNDAAETITRAQQAGGKLLSALSRRPWGETVAYLLDPDGHVLAIAQQH